ncbi:tRNA dihydrouridine synthase [Microbulbifer harenosus]|uniref:tRNA-dihydrouridine(16) synthase n=1 Tax=Microbulbifer harenosus TaxID=2576840 RepID=A0ABY2UKI8_9GAMM|nr:MULTISPECIES: tRNA-dihydrouridine synthase [Microbulbifer]QIL91760.1 tRNA dihydrouridine(16) synthase DusC [Microbulbifer sp. SH-1]TLM77819.1 tRNA dihydrouridine(16) synthase DusC [Microbulbifer harenosus]
MKIYQAPMEGVIDHHVRELLSAIGGIDVCVTEFVRVTHTKLPRKVFTRFCPELEQGAATPSGTPVKLQLLGGNPESMACNAARAVEAGARAIDLNFGCPAKSVNNSDGGACLLQSPSRVEGIVAAVRKAVPVDVPVSAKIRLGYEDRRSYLDNARAAEAGGASELAVHARSKVDGYRPPAYWEYIGEIRQHIDIPVIANGDLWTVQDFLRCRDVTGCNAFMFGRSLLARPDIGLQIRAYCSNQPYEPMSWSKIVALLYRYYETTRSDYPGKYLGNRIKQWLAYLKLSYPQAAHFFEEIKRLREPELLEQAFARQLGNSPREIEAA